MTGERRRSFADLPRAFGETPVRGRTRPCPEDFRVDEVSAFAPDGEGEHLLPPVRKRGANTEWVARRLAAHAGLAPSAVGHAGPQGSSRGHHPVVSPARRERPGPGLGGNLAAEGVAILEALRHRRKLHRGALRGNRFLIRVRDALEIVVELPAGA